jgi:hypothetical protein
MLLRNKGVDASFKCTDAGGGLVVRATAIFVDPTMTSAGINDRGLISAFWEPRGGVAFCVTMCSGEYVVKGNLMVMQYGSKNSI